MVYVHKWWGRVVAAIVAAALAMSLGTTTIRTWGAVIRGWDRALLGPAEVQATRNTETGAPGAVSSPARGLPSGMVLGYLYDPSANAGTPALLSHYLPALTGIIPFWYAIQSNGDVSGRTDPEVMRWARQHHVWTFALVQNMAGSPVFARLLGDPVARRRAIANMLTLVEANGFNGVNLDWEGIAAADRTAFSGFVRQLASVMHRHGYYVTLSVPAETGNQPHNAWTGGYDYRALGRFADLLIVMAYDQHWAGGSPGPIASSGWVESVLNYAISVVPPKKIILGVPGYGYDWSGQGGAVPLSYSQARLLESRYSHSTANHFAYVQNGQPHSVWFENTQSFLRKIQLVAGYELKGIALWRLGIEDPKMWQWLQ